MNSESLGECTPGAFSFGRRPFSETMTRHSALHRGHTKVARMPAGIASSGRLPSTRKARRRGRGPDSALFVTHPPRPKFLPWQFELRSQHLHRDPVDLFAVMTQSLAWLLSPHSAGSPCRNGTAARSAEPPRIEAWFPASSMRSRSTRRQLETTPLLE